LHLSCNQIGESNGQEQIQSIQRKQFPSVRKKERHRALNLQGISSKEIAAQLSIPTRTVESSRERVQEKVGARNMVGIAMYAIKTGIFNLEPV
jgi:DNA-binding NarL/FixJ family response regulator